MTSDKIAQERLKAATHVLQDALTAIIDTYREAKAAIKELYDNVPPANAPAAKHSHFSYQQGYVHGQANAISDILEKVFGVTDSDLEALEKKEGTP